MRYNPCCSETNLEEGDEVEEFSHLCPARNVQNPTLSPEMYQCKVLCMARYLCPQLHYLTRNYLAPASPKRKVCLGGGNETTSLIESQLVLG